MTDRHKDIIKIIEYHGHFTQTMKALEEIAELQTELIHKLSGRDNIAQIVEEIADVKLMLLQLQSMFDITDQAIDSMIDYKINRTLKRIDRGE